MPKVAIITDTDSSLPVDLAGRYNIQQIPITVQFGQKGFLAVAEIDDARTFTIIDQEKQLPTTSAPNPGQFSTAFQQAFDSGAESILCFCVSSAVSGTYNAALVARDLLPDRDIRVVDTCQLSMGQGFMVLAAAEAIAAGEGSEAALNQAWETGKRVSLYAALSTLKYLAMSGRVGHLAAGLASLLDVRPILTVKDGKLDMLERSRTRHKAWARVMELTCETMQGLPAERMAILHVDARSDAEAFLGKLRSIVQVPEDVLITELTPGLSVHAGAGLVGVCLVAHA